MVLQSPDFRSCRASCDIQTEPKVLIGICKHMKTIGILDRDQADDSETEDHGSYMLGGSAFGWNFITLRSIKKAAYYEVPKEQFRADAGI